MKIPNNSLTKEIKEIVRLCKKLKEDPSDDRSWFKPPAKEEENSEWERINGIAIPESYIEWLRFSNGSQILDREARLFGTFEFRLSDDYVPDDYVVIGMLIGDGERLCFSKNSGKIVRCLQGKSEVLDSFADVLREIIRSGKDESGLSKEAEDLLLKMVAESKDDA